MRLASALLLVFTSAMILVHLTSTRLLRRAWAGEAPGRQSVLNLFRFEGIYYLALMAYVLWQSGRFLLIPLVVMAALHVAGWAVAERRREWLANAGGAARAHILTGVQAFDLAETVVLVYIGWVLARAILSPPERHSPNIRRSHITQEKKRRSISPAPTNLSAGNLG